MRWLSLPLFELGLLAAMICAMSILADVTSKNSTITWAFDQVEHRVTVFQAERMSDAEMERRIPQRIAELEANTPR